MRRPIASKSERSGTGVDMANLSKVVCHGESDKCRFGNLEASVRSPRRAIDVFRDRDLIEAGLNEAAAGFARQGLWGLYFYGLADVVAWRGGERRQI